LSDFFWNVIYSLQLEEEGEKGVDVGGEWSVDNWKIEH
jgi:hypothetical protein